MPPQTLLRITSHRVLQTLLFPPQPPCSAHSLFVLDTCCCLPRIDRFSAPRIELLSVCVHVSTVLLLFCVCSHGHACCTRQPPSHKHAPDHCPMGRKSQPPKSLEATNASSRSPLFCLIGSHTHKAQNLSPPSGQPVLCFPPTAPPPLCVCYPFRPCFPVFFCDHVRPCWRTWTLPSTSQGTPCPRSPRPPTSWRRRSSPRCRPSSSATGAT